jgi:predicted house-cleaning NTP pyrophosphatase (Maf/HAM1 superfamily)
VTFAELSDKEILAYVETGEPMDKAGGYGIQGLAGSLDFFPHIRFFVSKSSL